MTIAEELRALAERVPADGPPAVTLAWQRGTGAAEAVTAALSTDPTLAERQQRWPGVLAELLRRLTRWPARSRWRSRASNWPLPGRAQRAWDASIRWPRRSWTRYRGLSSNRAASHDKIGIPVAAARGAAIRQQLLEMPAPVVADALSYHHVTATRLAAQAGATWSGYASGDHLRSPAD